MEDVYVHGDIHQINYTTGARLYAFIYSLCQVKNNLHVYCSMFIPVWKLSCELQNVGSFLLVLVVPPVTFVSLVEAAQALQSASVSISGTLPLGHSLIHKQGICPHTPDKCMHTVLIAVQECKRNDLNLRGTTMSHGDFYNASHSLLPNSGPTANYVFSV